MTTIVIFYCQRIRALAHADEKANAAAGRYQYDLGQQGTIGIPSTHESDDYRNTVLSSGW
ncbi:hypothetical protein P4S63_21365 [Pseudoalteromonas sp. B193]